MTKHKEFNYLLGPIATKFSNSSVGTWKSVKPIISQKKCVQCKQCIQYCPTGVITFECEKDEKIKFDYEYCKGCGICSNICLGKCIIMVKNEN